MLSHKTTGVTQIHPYHLTLYLGHPLCLQERIAKAHGSQCGFCTPGMVMSMYALLRNKPQPSMDDITQALAGLLLLISQTFHNFSCCNIQIRVRPASLAAASLVAGNLCRCTGYRPIVDGCRTFCQVRS